MKGTEQFWSVEGAEAILALRSKWLSEDGKSKHYWLGWPPTATAAKTVTHPGKKGGGPVCGVLLHVLTRHVEPGLLLKSKDRLSSSLVPAKLAWERGRYLQLFVELRQVASPRGKHRNPAQSLSAEG